MKSLKLSLLACVVTTGLALLSCKSDPCEKITYCGANGTATASTDGKSCACSCTAAYMGDSCKTTVISYLSGRVWSATRVQNGVTKPNPYAVKFMADGTSLTNIKIQNIGNYVCNPGPSESDVFSKAIIKSASKIEFDTTSQCGYSFNGAGEKQSDGSWKFTYTVKYADGSTMKTDDVVATVK